MPATPSSIVASEVLPARSETARGLPTPAGRPALTRASPEELPLRDAQTLLREGVRFCGSCISGKAQGACEVKWAPFPFDGHARRQSDVGHTCNWARWEGGDGSRELRFTQSSLHGGPVARSRCSVAGEEAAESLSRGSSFPGNRPAPALQRAVLLGRPSRNADPALGLGFPPRKPRMDASVRAGTGPPCTAPARRPPDVVTGHSTAKVSLLGWAGLRPRAGLLRGHVGLLASPVRSPPESTDALCCFPGWFSSWHSPPSNTWFTSLLHFVFWLTPLKCKLVSDVYPIKL